MAENVDELRGKLEERNLRLQDNEKEKENLRKLLVEEAEKVGAAITKLEYRDELLKELKEKMIKNKEIKLKLKGQLKQHKSDFSRLQFELINLQSRGVSPCLPEYVEKEKEVKEARLKLDIEQAERHKAEEEIKGFREEIQRIQTADSDLVQLRQVKEQLESDIEKLKLHLAKRERELCDEIDQLKRDPEQYAGRLEAMQGKEVLANLTRKQDESFKVDDTRLRDLQQQIDQLKRENADMKCAHQAREHYAAAAEDLVTKATLGRRHQLTKDGVAPTLLRLTELPTEFREAVPIIRLGEDSATLELDDLLLSRVIKCCRLEPDNIEITLFILVEDWEIASPIPARLLARYLTTIDHGDKMSDSWWTSPLIQADDTRFSTVGHRRGAYLWPDPIKIRVNPGDPPRVLFLVQAFSDLDSFPNPMLVLTHFLSSIQVIPLADATMVSTLRSVSELVNFAGQVEASYRNELAAGILPEVVFLLNPGKQSKPLANQNELGWHAGQQRVQELLRRTNDCACLQSSSYVTGFLVPQLREDPSLSLLRQVFTSEYKEQFSHFCESMFFPRRVHVKYGFDGHAVRLNELAQFAEWTVNFANLTGKPNYLQMQYYHKVVAMTAAEKVVSMLV